MASCTFAPPETVEQSLARLDYWARLNHGSADETMDQRCRRLAHAVQMEYTPVSWTDAARYVNPTTGVASVSGPHITDFVFTEVDDQQRRTYMLRYPNRNETVATLHPDDLMVVVGNAVPGDHHATRSIRLSQYLQQAHTDHATYTGLATSLWNPATDHAFTFSVQAVIVCGAAAGADKNFVGQSYNYGNSDPADPHALIVSVTPFGTSLQAARPSFVPSYHHSVRRDGTVDQYSLKVVKSALAIGADQTSARSDGHQVVYMGLQGQPVGNMLIHVSLPLQQQRAAVFKSATGFGAPYPLGSMCLQAAAAASPFGSMGLAAAAAGPPLVRGGPPRLKDGATTVGLVGLGRLKPDAPSVRLLQPHPVRHPDAHGRITITLTFFVDGDRPTEEDVRKVLDEIIKTTHLAARHSRVVGSLETLATLQHTGALPPGAAPIVQPTPVTTYNHVNPWQ